jgi:tRNA pseudouridine55 synthase
VKGGVLPILKAPGPTSHDLVAAVRKLTRGAKVGHLGTLDPAAAGVLVLLVGWATRWADFLDTGTKDYRAVVRFGIATATADVEGDVTEDRPTPDLTAAAAAAALGSLEGRPELAPPAFSAVRVGGRHAYRAARQGDAPSPAPRPMAFHRLDLVDFIPGSYPAATLAAEVGRGAYLRSLAVAWGERLGVPAHLEGLVRTRVGPWHLDAAHPWEEVWAAAGRGHLSDLVGGVEEAVAALPAMRAGAVIVGGHPPEGVTGPVRLMDPRGALVGVATAADGIWQRAVRVDRG